MIDGLIIDHHIAEANDGTMRITWYRSLRAEWLCCVTPSRCHPAYSIAVPIGNVITVFLNSVRRLTRQ